MVIDVANNNYEIEKKGVFISGANAIANKIDRVEIETPVCLHTKNTINSEFIGAFTYFSGSAFMNKASSIGRFCMINRDVVIGLANQSVQSLTSHMIFGTAECPWADDFHHLSKEERRRLHAKQKNKELKYKDTVYIGNDVWIGTGVQILLGVTIGDGCIIGAGSVVTKDIPPYCVVGGVPAKIIRRRFPGEIISCLLSLEWWKYGADVMKGLDITEPEKCVWELKRRIERGFPKYKCDRFVFYKNEKYYEHLDYQGNVISKIYGKGG